MFMCARAWQKCLFRVCFPCGIFCRGVGGLAPVILEGISRALPCLRQQRLSVKLRKSLRKSKTLRPYEGNGQRPLGGIWGSPGCERCEMSSFPGLDPLQMSHSKGVFLMMFGFQTCQEDLKRTDCKSHGHFKVTFDGDFLKML